MRRYDAVKKCHPLECDICDVEACQQPLILGRTEVKVFD